MASHRLRSVLFCTAALMLAGVPAAADQAADAKRFFDAAQRAFDEGRYVDAARAFEEAFRIKPHPFPLINAGDAWEKAGEYALAARIFERVLKLEQSQEQDRQDAIERLARLKPQLGTLELVGDPSLRVRVDDEEFRGGERVYLFPGEHTVSLADVEGAKVRKVKVPAGSPISVDLSSLLPEKRAEPGGGGPAPGDVGPAPVASGGVHPLTWVVLGVGGLGLAGGLVFGLQASDAAASFDARPNREDYDRFGDMKLATNVSLGVGVLGVGLGSYWLVQQLSGGGATTGRAPAPSRWLVGASAVPGGGWLGAQGRF